MKAVIMAGGEGTRLRPISANRPKPMVRLLDKPVLGHIISLLKKNDINEACLTLKYLPQVVTDYVGDGSELGVSIQSRIETEPLGTAGGVKACADFFGDDDFLVISGDCVCDFDLKKCIDFHCQKGADATIVLYAHPNPVEYGIVVTAPDGKVERFMEKPAGDKVVTDLINTGIYILSPEVLKLVPEGKSYDFGKDLFPMLLDLGKRVYGVRAEGYWCDIGSCEAYLQCYRDMLDKKYSLDTGIREKDGIWSAAPLKEDVNIIPPCYIGKNVTLEPGCSIGPYGVLGEGAYVSCGAAVADSVVEGHIGPGVNVKGSVLLKGSSAREEAVLLEGSVIGENTILGEGTVVHERIRIWPEKEIPAGSNIRENLVTGMLRSGLHFHGGGLIWGEFSVDVTPEACFAIGSAAASDGKRVGVGFSGGTAAKTAALAIMCGVCSGGGKAVELDSAIASCFSYSVHLYNLPWGIFVKQTEGKITLSFFDGKGLNISREKERKIEAALAGGDYFRAESQKVGDISYTAGNGESYIASAVRCGQLGGFLDIQIALTGSGCHVKALRKVLEGLNTTVVKERPGVPVLRLSRDGFLLEAKDEKNKEISSGRLLSILVLTEFKNGADSVAVPYTAPAVIDILAKEYGAKVLRVGKDEGAEEFYQRYFRDGVFASARLVGLMRKMGKTLSQLNDSVPQFSTATIEIPIVNSKAAVMRKLQESMAEASIELFSGIGIHGDKSWVHIVPSVSRQILKVTGECAEMEAAEELCNEVSKLAKELDKN